MKPPGHGFELLLTEADYRYGSGPLRMRIEVIDHAGRLHLDGEFWLPVHGTRLRFDGVEAGTVQLLVRAARLPERPPAR
ncbi:hypothetical protein GCM10010399_92850 [Dactylosporangium fulvum]|uniref:NfeD-like C-terminal domain-containing protein n=1 Tax=Dactylosporangium fulvum TaxID=53359 RepID=A0ABY5VQY1_9ACTN|nr:hypothetical protein [Dactylosporangium fulvum]UWP78898.1 hypothetical protein Dfulv_27420 [Dactylosporangium fulvum]